jgi:hypothetical protein
VENSSSFSTFLHRTTLHNTSYTHLLHSCEEMVRETIHPAIASLIQTMLSGSSGAFGVELGKAHLCLRGHRLGFLVAGKLGPQTLCIGNISRRRI